MCCEKRRDAWRASIYREDNTDSPQSTWIQKDFHHEEHEGHEEMEGTRFFIRLIQSESF